MTRVVVAVLSVLLLVPTAAGARTLVVSRDGLAAGPVLTADGRVAVAERAPGGLRVFVIDPSGSRPRQDVDFVTAPRRVDAFNELTLAGTGGVLAASVSTLTPNDPRTGGFLRLGSRVMTLLPTVKVAACGGRYPFGDGLQAAGGVGFVATLGEDCAPLGGAVIVHTPAGMRAIAPAPGGQTSHLHAAGDFVAWAEVTAGPPIAYSIVLARATTGRVELRIPVQGGFGSFGAEDLGVGADGTLVWVQAQPGPGCSRAVYAASPAEPVPRLLSLPGTPCPFGAPLYRVPVGLGVAGTSVVYPAAPGWAVNDGQGVAHTVGELRATSADPGPVAFDGHTIYAINHDCDADRLIGVDAARAGRPPSSPWPDCPASPAGRRRVTVGADLRVPVTLSCPVGCHGTLRLAEERHGRQRLAGRGVFDGSGRVTVRIRLRRDAIGRAGCSSGLRLRATLYPAVDPTLLSQTPLTRPAGVLRVRSRHGCRRLPAPAFTKPPRLLP